MPRAVGVTSVDDYGAEFELDDGARRYLVGPDALALAEQLSAPRPEPMAPRPPPPAFRPPRQLDRLDRRGQFAAPQQQAPAAARSMMAAPPAEDMPMVSADALPTETQIASGARTPTRDELPTERQVDAERADAQRRQQLMATPEGRVALLTEEAAREMDRPVTSYSPGYDPRADAAARFAVPESRTVKQAGALPVGAEDFDSLNQAYQLRGEAARELAGAELVQAQAAQQAARLQQSVLAQQAAAEAARVAALEAAAERARAQHQQLEQQLAEQRIDPNRLFKEGKLGRLSSAIAMTLGELGARMLGGPNTAADMINGMINADIASQEREWNIKRERAQNMYRELYEQYGDRDQARAGLKALQLQQAQAVASEMAAASRSPVVQAQFKEKLAQLELERQKAVQELVAKAVGQVEESQAFSMKAPKAGGVSSRPRTLKERLQYAADVQGLGLQLEGLPDAKEQRAQQFELEKAGVTAGAKRASTDREYQWKLGERLADVDASTSAAQELAEKIGFVRQSDGTYAMPKDGKLRGVGGPLNVKGALRAQTGQSQFGYGQDVEQAMRNTVDKFGRSRSGAAIPPEEFESLRKTLVGTGTPEALLQGINSVLSENARRSENFRAGAGVEVTRGLERQKTGNRNDRVELEPMP